MQPKARHSCPQRGVPAAQEQRQPACCWPSSWFTRDEFAAALEAWPQLADDWGTADHTEYNRRLQRHLFEMPAAHGAILHRPDPHRSPTQLVLTDRQRPRFWVCAFPATPAELARTALGRADRMATVPQRPLLVPEWAQVQAVLRPSDRRSDPAVQ